MRFGTGSLGSLDCERKVKLGSGSGAEAFQSLGRTHVGCWRDIERRPKIVSGKRDERRNMLTLLN